MFPDYQSNWCYQNNQWSKSLGSFDRSKVMLLPSRRIMLVGFSCKDDLVG